MIEGRKGRGEEEGGILGRVVLRRKGGDGRKRRVGKEWKKERKEKEGDGIDWEREKEDDWE